jgi:murein DD-endopeptidase MepM/ murein hydrolase activator NlpD
VKALVIGLGGGAALLLAVLGSTPVRPLALTDLVPGAVVTQPFGCSPLELEPVDLSCPTRHFHTGIDLAAPMGTPVHAAAAGVAKVVDGPGYGLHVIVTHDRRAQTLYCHLSAALVKTGDTVGRGELIGLVGSSGMSTGPHLHFEVRLDGSPVNPIGWLSS